ncbi:hypothetical protein Celaphus_00015042, partial [Cervus elaphus hippelaphus]
QGEGYPVAESPASLFHGLWMLCRLQQDLWPVVSAVPMQALRRPGLPCLLCGLQEERAPLPTLLPEERCPGSLTETHPGLAAPSHQTHPLGPCRPSDLTSPAI